MQDISRDSGRLDAYFLNSATRHDLIALMPAKVDRVLEVGCGIGKTGKAIVSQKQAKVIGLDISSEAIEVARGLNCYEKLVICNLDHSAIPAEIEKERFDCILYPDVLEHLGDPWYLLQSHASLLADGGIIIASIPNIRHIRVVKDLVLKGTWTYREMGILDRSHLRFFTKKTMIDLFESSGYRVISIESRSIAGTQWLKSLHRLLFGLDEFLTTQYLIRAEKKR